MEYVLRAAGPADEGFLTGMLELAAKWRDESDARLLTAAELRYVEGFGRPGDIGVIAEVAGEPAGAAWCRLLTGDGRGYGYVADDVPELAIGVACAYRGRGLGSALIGALTRAVAAAGYRAVSLSVEPDNPSRRVYERAGFTLVGEHEGAWKMLADHSVPPDP